MGNEVVITEIGALKVALESISYQRAACDHEANLYEKYGEGLARDDQRREARRAYELRSKLLAAEARLRERLTQLRVEQAQEVLKKEGFYAVPEFLIPSIYPWDHDTSCTVVAFKRPETAEEDEELYFEVIFAADEATLVNDYR